MIYEKIKKLNEAKFYRHTGVHAKQFNKYLEYLKEYPTFSQMSIVYNISQSSCFRNVNWVENALLENPDFKLSKKNYPKTEKGISIQLRGGPVLLGFFLLNFIFKLLIVFCNLSQ